MQVGRKREAEEVGGLRGDEVVDGRKGVRAEMVATSDGPHRMPGKGTSEGIKHFELTGLGYVSFRGVSLFKSRMSSDRQQAFMGRHSPPLPIGLAGTAPVPGRAS